MPLRWVSGRDIVYVSLVEGQEGLWEVSYKLQYFLHPNAFVIPDCFLALL